MAKGKGKGKNLKTVHVALVLDRSGSMMSVDRATIDAVNEYVGGLKGDSATPYRFSLTLFDGVPPSSVPPPIERRYVDAALDEFEPLTIETYQPRGMTPLYDAVCMTIKELEGKFGDDPVLVAVMTDGEENASREYTLDHLKAMIDRLTKAGNFTFTFMGANIDAFAVAHQFGVAKGNVLAFDATATGVALAMHTHTLSTSSYAQSASRSGGATSSFYASKDEEGEGSE